MSGVNGKSGKKPNQRMKHYFVLQFLQRNTDENHYKTAKDIVAHLDGFGIQAERRSIYKDIHEINLVNIMLDNDCSFDEAEEMLSSDPSLAIIQCKGKLGYYVANHPISNQNARLLAECVYTARYVPQKKAKEIIGEIGSLLSDHYKNDINHDAFTVDRIRINNENLFKNVDTIQTAMATRLNNKTHVPEKIGFQYLKYSIQGSIPKLTERKHGEYYIVSPYAIIINEGNYYLLALNDNNKKMTTYRIDRMRVVKRIEEPREQTEFTKEMDFYLETYLQRVFNMYGGKQERIYIRFINSLLDTMVDRFGIENATYSKHDEKHYTVSVIVEISPTFFGWLAGFGNKATLLSPNHVVEEYKEHLKKILDKYSNNT